MTPPQIPAAETANLHTLMPSPAVLERLHREDLPAVVGMSLASLVMFVSNLDTSVSFYRKLLCADVTVIDDTAALLVLADGNQVYLRDIGTRGSHPLGGLGVQYILWSAGSQEEFSRCQDELRRLSPKAALTKHEGFEMMEGRDPDDMPVLISYPGPERAARKEIISRIYEW